MFKYAGIVKALYSVVAMDHTASRCPINTRADMLVGAMGRLTFRYTDDQLTAWEMWLAHASSDELATVYELGYETGEPSEDITAAITWALFKPEV